MILSFPFFLFGVKKMSLHAYVEALVREQMIEIENSKPIKKRLEVWLLDHHETTLKRAKELLETLKEPEYDIQINDLKQVNYPYAIHKKGGGYEPALMWEAILNIKDKNNAWRPDLWGHGALFSNKEYLLSYLKTRAEEIIGYDKQHIRELFGFRDGKKAYCQVCDTPFSAFCSKKFHECETQRQGGYLMK